MRPAAWRERRWPSTPESGRRRGRKPSGKAGSNVKPMRTARGVKSSFMARKRKEDAAKDALAGLWPAPRPERSVALLKALNILTREGALNADSRRKLKQVLHLTQILRPALEALLKDSQEP